MRILFCIVLAMPSLARAEDPDQSYLANLIAKRAFDAPVEVIEDCVPFDASGYSTEYQIRSLIIDGCVANIRRHLTADTLISEVAINVQIARIGADDTVTRYTYLPRTNTLAAMGDIDVALPAPYTTPYRHRTQAGTAEDDVTTDESRPMHQWLFEDDPAQSARHLIVHGPTQDRQRDLAEPLMRYQLNDCHFSS